MLKFFRFILLAAILISVATSCNAYQKMLNNPDVKAKYKAAEAYYDTGEYRRANRLYEQILPSYRGKPQAQRVIFYFADTYLQTKDYYLAAYQFESFVKSFPKSDKLQEASFLAAKCYYLLSPRYSLDQTNTNDALDKLQIFIDNYPNSEFLDEANSYVQELQTKLEKKDFEISKQYYTIRDYKAAIKSLDNFIGSYPGTPYREDALYYKFLSSYEIATNSVYYKKLERLKDLQGIYDIITRYYPETLFLEDLDDKMERVVKEISLLENNTTATAK
ncbi:MAG: outer membrane protein assembly factor BamD [Flavobacteriaceae bacterium]